MQSSTCVYFIQTTVNFFYFYSISNYIDIFNIHNVHSGPSNFSPSSEKARYLIHCPWISQMYDLCFIILSKSTLVVRIQLKNWSKLNTNGRIMHNLRYVDDTALLAENEQELQDLMHQVKSNGAKYGLDIKPKLCYLAMKGQEQKWTSQWTERS